MIQRVRPLKIESPAEGGLEDDVFSGPTETDIGGDFLDAAGLTVQNLGAKASTSDALCRIQRAGNDLQLCDPNAGVVPLQSLLSRLSGLAGSHNALRDPIHFLSDGGPGDGFASGCVQTTTYLANSPLVAAQTWWTSAAQTTPLYSVTYAYAANSPVPSTVTRTLYDAAGAVVRTFVETPTYAAGTPLQTSRTRTWS